MYETITEHLDRVRQIGQTFPIDESIILETLFPPNAVVFYRYHGSYTTPYCHESVTWIMFPQLVFISDKQVIRLLINI